MQVTIDPQVVRDVIKWINDHPNHVNGDIDADTESQLWFHYCANNQLINEYESADHYMEQDKVAQISLGCDFIFSHGPEMGQPCERPLYNNTKCNFHAAAVFTRGREQRENLVRTIRSMFR